MLWEVCRTKINASLSPGKLGIKTQEVQLCSGVKSVTLAINFLVYRSKLLPELCVVFVWFTVQNKVLQTWEADLAGGLCFESGSYISNRIVSCFVYRIIYSWLHNIKDTDTKFTSLFIRLVSWKTFSLETIEGLSEFFYKKLLCQILSCRL